MRKVTKLKLILATNKKNRNHVIAKLYNLSTNQLDIKKIPM